MIARLLMILLILQRNRNSLLFDHNRVLNLFRRIISLKRNHPLSLHLPHPIIPHQILDNLIHRRIIKRVPMEFLIHSIGLIAIVQNVDSSVANESEIVFCVGWIVLSGELVLLGSALGVPGCGEEVGLVVEEVFLVVIRVFVVEGCAVAGWLWRLVKVLCRVHPRYLLQQCLRHLNPSLLPAPRCPMRLPWYRFTPPLMHSNAPFWIIVREYFYLVSFVATSTAMLALDQVVAMNGWILGHVKGVG